MHQKELHVVRFSMIVLFSALMIVYLLLYQIKGDSIANQLSTVNTTVYQESGIDEESGMEESGIFSQINSGSLEEDLLLEDVASETNTGETIAKKTESLFETKGTTTGKNETGDNKEESINKITVLSGTSLRYGRVESVEKLGISYQYALKDQKDIYYVFLDPKKYKFDEIVRSLGGSLYVLTTEKEIMENKLFGDKVTFINLPEYKDKKVIMLVEIDKKLWLIQVDHTTYYKSKTYLKQLFIK